MLFVDPKPFGIGHGMSGFSIPRVGGGFFRESLGSGQFNPDPQPSSLKCNDTQQ